jgi:nitrite reductase (NADH) large subunit
LAPSETLFTPLPNMAERVPLLVWRALRWIAGACLLGLAGLALKDAALAGALFWGGLVPLLPLLFVVAPGVWRNVCPLASANQIPRTLGFSRNLTVSPRVAQFTALIGAGLFVLVVPLRLVMLEQNGVALAVFLLGLPTLAFVGGLFYKGKSGWCSQICPMLQVERFYGQSPLQIVRNAHCRPCVGCSANCYDFNPTAAYLADLHDPNPRLGVNRRLFAGAMPWFILAFFTQAPLADLSPESIVQMYGRILLLVAAGIGAFFVIEQVFRIRAQQLVLLHVVAALNLFYFFAAPRFLAPLGTLAQPVGLLFELALLGVTIVWTMRAWPRERAFLTATDAAPRVADTVLRAAKAARTDKVEVRFQSGPAILVKVGEILLNVAEANQIPIEAGCRMGMCGADPVRVIDGLDNLSASTLTERGTLERLGLDTQHRLACIARVEGGVTVAAAGAEMRDGTDAGASSEAAVISTAAQRIVVVGGGVAGVTAAIELRRVAPATEIVLLGGEPYDFYNRMALGRLIDESTSIDKLRMMPRDWHAQKGIKFVRGTRVTAIQRANSTVLTDLGDTLPYDRLILATGARSAVVPMEGWGTPGTFVVRTINDAVEIQQYVRRNRVHRAVIVGGGLLGLEIAHAISELNVRVTVLDRTDWPLNRQLDQRAGVLLWQLMADLGVDFVARAQVRRIVGSGAVEGVQLQSGETLTAGVCLIAAGITPDVEVASSAGLDVATGIVVDERMRTSDPAIYAAGDVAELGGRIQGLWTASMDQARVAAINAVGGNSTYVGTAPPTMLKVAAIDMLSVGTIHRNGERDREVAIEDVGSRQYRKLVLHDERLVGGLLVGHKELFDQVIAAVDDRQDLSGHIDELLAGDWLILGS